jgi:hypothetical protein
MNKDLHKCPCMTIKNTSSIVVDAIIKSKCLYLTLSRATDAVFVGIDNFALMMAVVGASIRASRAFYPTRCFGGLPATNICQDSLHVRFSKVPKCLYYSTAVYVDTLSRLHQTNCQQDLGADTVRTQENTSVNQKAANIATKGALLHMTKPRSAAGIQRLMVAHPEMCLKTQIQDTGSSVTIATTVLKHGPAKLFPGHGAVTVRAKLYVKTQNASCATNAALLVMILRKLFAGTLVQMVVHQEKSLKAHTQNTGSIANSANTNLMLLSVTSAVVHGALTVASTAIELYVVQRTACTARNHV